MATTSFPTFDGTRLGYPLFMRDTYGQAANRSTQTGALLSHIMTPEERLARFGPNPPQPPPPPGQIPIVPAVAPATGVMSHLSLLLKVYEITYNDYNTWSREEMEFTTDFVGALTPETKQRLASVPFHGVPAANMPAGPPAPIAERTLPVLMALLRQEYGQLTVHDLTRVRLGLETPFNPATTNIERYIASHREAHQILASNNQDLPSQEKVRIFKSGLTQCALYKACITIYENNNPAVVNQNFEHLAEQVRQFQPDELLNTGNTGYANQAHHSDNKAGVETFLAANKLFFCHTHGLTFHSSANCRTPGTGHVKTTTFSNRNGSTASDKIPLPHKPASKKNT
jgi:hypothetical protein